MCTCNNQLQPHDRIKGVCPSELDEYLIRLDRELAKIAGLPIAFSPSGDVVPGFATERK